MGKKNFHQNSYKKIAIFVVEMYLQKNLFCKFVVMAHNIWLYNPKTIKRACVRGKES